MAPAPRNIARSVFSVFFEYDTPRIVHIRSKKVGVFNRFIQLCIIGYVIGYAIIYKKGYQVFDNVESAVTTKLKGVAFIQGSKETTLNNTVWDVADYVVPPQENNAFFVTTNLIVTNDQSQSECPEDPKIKGAACNSDTDCEPYIGKFLPGGSGVVTGVCNGTCVIHSWCPLEDGAAVTPDPPLLLASENFTVFVKNNIEFPKFNVKRRNLPSEAPPGYLESCNYNSGQNVDCPIFKLGTIVQGAGENYYEVAKENDKELSDCRFDPSHSLNKFCPIFVLSDIVHRAGEKYVDLATQGGVMQILITWNCNLDFSVDDCLPEYSFRRLDSATYNVSRGYNFRYAKFFKENGTETRTLYKAFGIKFVVTVTGIAGKFDAEPLFLNIGSGLALLSIATIICDIFVLYVLKARYMYKKSKYLDVEGDDAYKVMDEDREEDIDKES